MRLVLAVFCVIGFAGMAQAKTYHAGSECKPLETYAPSPDVEARAGYDQHGRPVASPDINDSTMDVEALKHPNIALDMPIKKYLKTDKYNGDFDRTDIQVGQLKVEDQGAVRLNGQTLSTGQQAVYPKGCE